MNIVFVGPTNSPGASDHIDAHQAKGHEVYIARLDKIDYEAAAQKICNADEVHVWLTDGFTGSAVSFYLGMAYMFSWANMGQNVHFEVKLFNDEHLGSTGILGQLVKRRST